MQSLSHALSLLKVHSNFVMLDSFITGGRASVLRRSSE